MSVDPSAPVTARARPRVALLFVATALLVGGGLIGLRASRRLFGRAAAGPCQTDADCARGLVCARVVMTRRSACYAVCDGARACPPGFNCLPYSFYRDGRLDSEVFGPGRICFQPVPGH